MEPIAMPVYSENPQPKRLFFFTSAVGHQLHLNRLWMIFTILSFNLSVKKKLLWEQ